MKAYGRVDVIYPRFLDFSFTSRMLYPWDTGTQYPLNRRLGGPQNNLEDMKKKLLTLLGF
jgi:hypothetical protein